MKNKLLPAIVIAFSSLLVISSCTKKKDLYMGDYSKNYFPLNLGKEIIYDVDSIYWDDVYDVRTLHHSQMRWVIADTFRDEEFRLSYRIATDIRPNDSAAWVAHRAIYVTPTETTLEYVEENMRFIKLIFPINNGGTWQGNRLMHTDLDKDIAYFNGWNYYYDKFSERFSNGFAYFDNTVTVNAVNDTLGNPELVPTQYAEKTFAKEVYAQGVGMVYREVTRWTYDPAATATPFRQGYSVVMKALDHN